MAEKDLKHMLQHTLRSAALLQQVKQLNVSNHMEMIHGPLWELNAVFLDAQLRALKDPKLKVLVGEITTAIADVHDLLGRILDWQPKPPTPVAAAAAAAASAAATAAGAAFNCSPPPLPCGPEVPDAFRHALLLEMKEKASRLSLLVSRGASMGLQKDMMESMDPRQEEFGDILRNIALQREDKKKDVIRSLQKRQNNEDIPLMLALRGPDGTGKTTLARMIFHDPWVRKHFDTRIWVDSPNCFSFDPISVARDFAESITKEPCSHLQHLQTLWLRINKELTVKRYLLVIDDVAIRKEDNDKWEQLKHVFLRVGLPGGRVIAVTSSPGDIMWGAFDGTFDIGRLSDDDWTRLFSSHEMILADKDRTPLIAKLLGLWFRYAEPSPSSQERLNVSHDDRYLPLLLQFLLPRNEQLRMYHSLFPQDNAPDLEDLLLMLTAEGLVPHPEQKAAATYLLRRLLLEQKKELTVTKLCRYVIMEGNVRSIRPQQWPHVALSVHQNTSVVLPKEQSLKLRTLILVRDEEMILANQKCRIQEIPEDIFKSLGDLRVLDLRATMIRQLPATVCEMVNLRYLNLSWSDLEMLPESFCDLRNLQTLRLDHCEKLHQLPEEIHNLRKLQVLKLAYCTKLKMLPESVTSLLHLQELDIEGCDGLVELPEDLKNLKKLRYLNMMRCAKLTRMPHGIQHLTELRTLLGYVAVDAPRSCTITKLQHLENLEELHLQNLERVSNPRDAQSMKLEDKRYLRRVQLIWNNAEAVDTKTVQDNVERDEAVDTKTVQDNVEREEPASSKVQPEVLENLKVNTALRKLEIVSYQGEELPKWMKEGQPYHFTLVEIKLVNLKRWKELPPLGRLPRLRIVEITGMEGITAVRQEFYDTRGTFPSLEKLTFSDMPYLEKWESKTGEIPKNKTLLPRLTELTLIQCPRLKDIEVKLPKVTRLNLWLNNEELLRPETADKFESLTELELVGWKHLPDALRHFKSITSLRIVRCENFVSLPDWLKGFESLRVLKISSIPEGLREALPHLDISIDGRPGQNLARPIIFTEYGVEGIGDRVLGA